MFMIPIPPTRRLIAATPEEEGEGPRRGVHALQGVLLVRDGEVVVVWVGQAVALGEEAGEPFLQVLEPVAACALEVDRVHLGFPGLGPGEALQVGGKRHEDLVVRADEALVPLVREDADDGERDPVDPDPLPQGVVGSEEVLGDAVAEDGDPPFGGHVVPGEEAPLLGLGVPHLGEVRPGAHHRGLEVRAPTADLEPPWATGATPTTSSAKASWMA